MHMFPSEWLSKSFNGISHSEVVHKEIAESRKEVEREGQSETPRNLEVDAERGDAAASVTC